MKTERKKIYTEHAETIKKHFLYQGMIFLSREECLITTILGSCIAVCLWDPHAGFGGMNHYVLPFWNGECLPTPRYGNIAIPKLIEKMMIMGCKKSNLKAKVFGGATVLFSTGNGDLNMAAQNIILAKDILSSESIPTISHDVGERYGRKILFNTKTGEVMLRRFRSSISK